MLIKTLELNAEIKLVDLSAGEQNDPEFLKLNPLHQVPVLVDGDFVLTESRAIMAYLVNKYKPDSELYPSEPRSRALVDQRLYYDATVVFESCAHIIVRVQVAASERRVKLFFSFQRSVFYKGVKKIPAEDREKLVNTLNVLDGYLAENKWIAGSNMTIADLSILGTITSIKVKFVRLITA